MKTRILTVGTKMPEWVLEGAQEYSKRIPKEYGFSLVEVPLAKRSKSQSLSQCVGREGDAMLAKIEKSELVIALDVKGKTLDTTGLANKLQRFRDESRNICLLIGGPDGLDPRCIERANETWSLSALTLPHPLVRILLAEQLYRAISLLQGHPYHRE